MTREDARKMVDKLFGQIEWEKVALSVTFENEYVEFNLYKQNNEEELESRR